MSKRAKRDRFISSMIPWPESKAKGNPFQKAASSACRYRTICAKSPSVGNLNAPIHLMDLPMSTATTAAPAAAAPSNGVSAASTTVPSSSTAMDVSSVTPAAAASEQPPLSAATAAPPPPPVEPEQTKLALLQSQIHQLSDLYEKIVGIRQLPSQLLSMRTHLDFPPISSTFSSPHIPLASLQGAPAPPALRPEFKQLSSFNRTLSSDPVQKALRAAQQSAKADKTAIAPNCRRDVRKRRRAPSLASPQPYTDASLKRPKAASLFPRKNKEDERHPLRRDGLCACIRQFNRARLAESVGADPAVQLFVWTKHPRTGKGLPKTGPLVLQLRIRDVLIAYLTVTNTPDDPMLVTENVVFFGPREQKSPHSHSQYAVYRHLSRQLTKVLVAEPHVDLEALLDMLCSYQGLFLDRCTNCNLVLSTDEHFPPIRRKATNRSIAKPPNTPPITAPLVRLAKREAEECAWDEAEAKEDGELDMEV
ncbi:hypothetical protein FISHEDRAFT_61852 [Fistulina hepatica ATCC 64428]|uniref:Uncharacterized protein n=1 Tax=Fistulina hepatica ATCC 64428 TaxID=1128425 RepID=A0A0D7A0K5_9AGAR|nr:hypothetical protein FISHEDRAFT_61852 [Fistulina hepatica ATCC 64428]